MTRYVPPAIARTLRKKDVKWYEDVVEGAFVELFRENPASPLLFWTSVLSAEQDTVS